MCLPATLLSSPAQAANGIIIGRAAAPGLALAGNLTRPSGRPQ
jgi:hypothetical protein